MVLPEGVEPHGQRNRNLCCLQRITTLAHRLAFTNKFASVGVVIRLQVNSKSKKTVIQSTLPVPAGAVVTPYTEQTILHTRRHT